MVYKKGLQRKEKYDVECFFLLAAMVLGSSNVTVEREKKFWKEAVQEVPIISKCKERNRVKTKNREMTFISNFVSYLFLN